MVKEMVLVPFPATKNIDEVVRIIEKHRMKFGLDTYELSLTAWER